MEVSLHSNELWEIVLEETKDAQKKGTDPFLWAIKLSSNLGSSGVSLPSPELAHLLVSYICWENNLPISWKFLEKAMVVNLVPPVLVLALFSTRIIPCRNSKPAAYRLYMELLKRYAFNFKTHISAPNYHNVMTSVGKVLDLDEIFEIPAIGNLPGVALVGFVFATVWQLVDASLDDEGWLELAQEKNSVWTLRDQEMDTDCCENYDDKIFEHLELRNLNTIMAVELIGLFFESGTTSRILYLAHKNMPKHWGHFMEQIQLLGANSLALRSSKSINPEILYKFVSGSCTQTSRECRTKSPEQLHVNGSLASFTGLCHGVSPSSLWTPLDIILEDAMIGPHVTTTSAVEIIIGVLKILQAVNSSTWHDTFLALWIAALRIVQRERDPIEGPMPRLASRMCMLLSVTTLMVSDLIDEEENPLDELDCSSTNHYKDKTVPGNRRKALVSSLQMLSNYMSLLNPPQSVISAADLAAAKAMMAISGIDVGSEYLECMTVKNLPIDCSGNMLHLIVEACITRNLIDTSVYYWPGYVNSRANKMPDLLPSDVQGWSSFMKGAPLSQMMINSMVATPASSLGELEKISELAVNGSDDDRFYAATILCGASLLQGWNVQEHTLYFITRLLSPPLPADHNGGDSHLISYAPMLNALLVGIDSIDCVQIFSLHGLVPHLAASLMAICEVFGSCLPHISWKLPTGEEISAHAVFSNAFAEFLKLWRFNHPPLEYGVGDVPPVGSQLTPEYLLLARNCHLPSSGNFQKNRNKRRLSEVACSLSPDPIFLDQFPKLKFWYQQHRACIASTLSGLVGGTPVHQLVDVLLTMFFKKGAQSVNSMASGSGSSNSSGQGREDDDSLRPNLPAWVIMEAVPFVVDAALTACAHEQVSPRELATGLKNLADFLPASIATIVSYFSAEVTRGVWKPALMNGTDWPSPKANLSNVEEQIRKILAATGVDVPKIAAGGSSAATLPLPLAAFVSLTITYKIDKSSERFLHLAGPCMESLAAGCPWPCLPIVTSLWTQKARRWTDFLTFSASRTVFLHNNGAVVQLLKSCFATTLSPSIVGPLLGHGVGSHVNGGISPVAPGILYLRVYRSIRDIMFLPEEIVSLLMQSVKEIAGNSRPSKSKLGLRYSQVSVAAAMTRLKVASSLAATLIWLSGGPELVQCLIKETLPSWFISVHRSEVQDDGNVSVFGGFALAYFALLCVAFAWGVDPTSACSSRRRMKVIGSHMSFLASALDGKISFGCDEVVWRVYVSGFLSLMVACTPSWVMEVDVDVLKRLSRGLRQMSEEELAVDLLASGGIGSMGAAAELIIQSDW